MNSLLSSLTVLWSKHFILFYIPGVGFPVLTTTFFIAVLDMERNTVSRTTFRFRHVFAPTDQAEITPSLPY